MKIISLIFGIIGLQFAVYSQQTITDTITHDGIQREYVLYIPASYTGDSPVPMVLNFHGYGSTANEQMWYGDFRPISDTAGFIIAHPQGTLFNGTTHWNVGGWTIGSTTDDVGFTDALLDTLAVNYNIDSTRVYATGMSNGGFMSFLLSCQLSERIAAIGSVTGSMTPETYDNCTPMHTMPILQIHGTDDGVVPYTGAAWSESIDNVLQYWVGVDNCNITPTITSLPDLDPNDGSTVEHYVYEGGDNNVTVEHYKVIGGGHTWPGNTFGGSGTNNDINASEEVWKFFSRYNLTNITGTEQLVEDNLQIVIYPNPTNSYITIELNFSNQMDYEIISSLGHIVIRGVIRSNNQQIDLSQLVPNIYFLNIEGRFYKILKTK
ncbi:MAG: hypothetical protein CL661_04510 [Bacteroidetes bacterium]|jgi:polyhydroxybutyrate depolymerase|nr:hypothetical protein [Bacteroidota bacterium]|tara:strand:- start:682 stop:1815 length:1134 start_codon:yes stop_codon:yes gene_type:complete